MNAKKLEPKSRYAEYDTDGDGIVSDEELARHQEMLQLELQEEKASIDRDWETRLWFKFFCVHFNPRIFD